MALFLVDDLYYKRSYGSNLGSCLRPVLLGILCYPVQQPWHMWWFLFLLHCFPLFSSPFGDKLVVTLYLAALYNIKFAAGFLPLPTLCFFFAFLFRLWIFKWLSDPSVETGAWWDLLPCDWALWHWDPLHHLQHCWSFSQWGKSRKIKHTGLHQLQQSV